jgi:hypothetical protein
LLLTRASIYVSHATKKDHDRVRSSTPIPPPAAVRNRFKSHTHTHMQSETTRLVLCGDLLLRSLMSVYAVFFGRPPFPLGLAGGSEETTGGSTVFVCTNVYSWRHTITLKGSSTMRVQTYATWLHRQTVPPRAGATPQSSDDLDGVIDTLIAQVAYYPSFVVQITSHAQGLRIQGSQPVIQTEAQRDGMVVLRTHGGQVWITQADYQRLVVA